MKKSNLVFKRLSNRLSVVALAVRFFLVAVTVSAVCILFSCSSTTEPQTEKTYGALVGHIEYGNSPECIPCDSVFIRAPASGVQVDSLNRFRFLEMPEGAYELKIGDTVVSTVVYSGETTHLKVKKCVPTCSTVVSRLVVVDAENGLEYGVLVRDSVLDLYSDLDSFSLRIGFEKACSDTFSREPIVSPLIVLSNDDMLFTGIPSKGWAAIGIQKNQDATFQVIVDTRTVFSFSVKKRVEFDKQHYLSVRSARAMLIPRAPDEVVNPDCPVSGDLQAKYIGFGVDTFLIDYELDPGNYCLMLVEKATGRFCSEENPSEDWGLKGQTADNPQWKQIPNGRHSVSECITIPNASPGLYDVFVHFEPPESPQGRERPIVLPNLSIELGPMSIRGVVESIVSISPPDSFSGDNRWFAGTIEVPSMIFRQDGEVGKR